MMISTRGRYALRVIVDLAEHAGDHCIPMKEVAQRQGISLKYLEKILPVLVAGKLVEGIHGKGGGYRLAQEPARISVGQVLRLTEGDLAPVSCLECSTEVCKHSSECRTLPMWSELNRRINEYLDSVTIADMMKQL